MSRVNKIITCLKWFDEGPDKMYRDFTSSDIMPHVCLIALHNLLYDYSHKWFSFTLHIYIQRIFFVRVFKMSFDHLWTFWLFLCDECTFASKVVKTYFFILILIFVKSIHPISNYFIDVILSLKRQRISQKSTSKAWAFLNLKVQIGYFLGILLTRYSGLFNTIASLYRKQKHIQWKYHRSIDRVSQQKLFNALHFDVNIC